MKTLEIPDAILRRAKAKAAERDIPLRQFVTEAVTERLEAGTTDQRSARLNMAGRLRHLRKENARINAAIEEEFESVDCAVNTHFP